MSDNNGLCIHEERLLGRRITFIDPGSDLKAERQKGLIVGVYLAKSYKETGNVDGLAPTFLVENLEGRLFCLTSSYFKLEPHTYGDGHGS